MVELCSIKATPAEDGAGGFSTHVDAFVKTEPPFDPGMFDPGQFDPKGAGDLLTVVASIDDARQQALQPRAAQIGVQRIGVRFRVAGSSPSFDPMMFDPAQWAPGGDRLDHLLVGPVSCSRSLDAAVQTASMDFGYVDGAPPLGSELRAGTPATGTKACTLSVAYRDANGDPFEIALITNGMADDTSSESAGGLRIQRMQLADAGRRYLGRLATRIIPAGSNLKPNRAIEALAIAGGVAVIDLPEMEGRLLKPVDLAEGDWYAPASGIADVRGYRLLWSPQGAFTAIRSAPEAERPRISWLFTEADIVNSANGAAQQVRLFPAPEAWTEVEARGTRQVTRGAACGLETVLLQGFALVTVIGPALGFVQSTGGSVSSSGATEQTYGSPVIGSQTLKNVSTRCGEIIAERTRTYAYANPLRARYRRDTDGTLLSYNTVYLEEDDASAIGHRHALPERQQISEVHFNRIFDAGLNLVEERKITRSLYLPRRHVKQRSARTDDWETATATSAYWDLGDGTAVTDTNESLVTTEIETVKFQNRSDGFLRSRTKTVQRYAKRQGWQYLYGDGSESSDSEESFREVERLEEQWIFDREGFYSETVQRYGLNGELLESTADTLLGAPPAVVTLEDLTPQAADFDTTEEFEAALAASRFEQEEIIASCDAPALLDVRPERKLPQAFFEWAESVAELENLCKRLILQGMSVGISFTLACNAMLREGDYIWVRFRPLGVDHAVHVKSVDHSIGFGVPCLTKVQGVIWPEVS